MYTSSLRIVVTAKCRSKLTIYGGAMSRALRIEYEGAWYHIINEGLEEISVFPSEEFSLEFFNIISDITCYFGIEVHAYILEKKGYQLLLHTPLGNLSAAMQYLNSVYTQRFNRLCERKGSLFCGRYKSIVFNADMYLLQVSRYIHWLPVINSYCSDIKKYTWSSCNVYLGIKKSPEWLHCTRIKQRLSASGLYADYKSYLDLGVDSQIKQFYEDEFSGSVLGPKSFKKDLLRMIDYKKLNEKSCGHCTIRIRPSIEQVYEMVEDKINLEDLYSLKSDKKLTRNIAMALCRDVGQYGLKDIADAFGFGHHHSVSVIVSRTRKKVDSHYRLKELYMKTKMALEDNFC